MTDYKVFHGEILNNIHVDSVIREYFPDYTYKGVYLDIGAFEPVTISNSYHFEQNGWDVYCFEANPTSINLLKSVRKKVFNYAIYDCDKDEIEFNIVNSNNWTAGFSAIELDNDIAKFFPCDNKIITKINIEQRSLDSIFAKELNHITNIDILKIDIEGGELKCLNGIDLKKYHPKLIVVENITNNKNIPEYLSQFHYILDKHISYNQFYIHKL